MVKAQGGKRPAPFVKLPLWEDIASTDSHNNNNIVLEGVVSNKENKMPRQRDQRRKYNGCCGIIVAGGVMTQRLRGEGEGRRV
jgi:hypothetical protein